jgi:hypothetical protein
VVGTDIDRDSIVTAQSLLSRFPPGTDWQALERSILNIGGATLGTSTIISGLELHLTHASYHNPFIPQSPSRHLLHETHSVPLKPEIVRAYDGALTVINHGCVDYPVLLDNCQLVIDARTATAPYRRSEYNVILARLLAGTL